MRHHNVFFLLVLGAIVIATGCKKDDESQLATENTITIKANFPTNSPFAFFSFKNNSIVANADSASNKWDIGIRLTTFLVNSNSSGPGKGGAILQNGIFDNVLAAPSTGYAYDTSRTQLAIKDGSWYDYVIATRSFTPKAGKVFLLKTAEGRYVKMELLDATYEPFIGVTPLIINYKIRFVYQADGSVNLSKN